jgi:hypothetical protein
LRRKSKDTGEVVKPATDSFKGEFMYKIQPKKSSMLLLGRKGKEEDLAKSPQGPSSGTTLLAEEQVPQGPDGKDPGGGAVILAPDRGSV